MAKPIAEIRKAEDGKPTPDEQLPGLIAELKGHEDAIREFMNLLDALKESGLLSLASGLARNYRYVMEELADGLSSEKSKTFLANALAMYTLLSSIDSERIAGFADNLQNAVNNAGEYEKQGKLGILSLLNQIGDRDVSTGIRVMLAIMKGFSLEKKDEP